MTATKEQENNHPEGEPELLLKNFPQKYSSLEAWLHDRLIANRALHLHEYIIEHGHLKEFLALEKEQQLLDVGCGGGQLAIRLKESYPCLQLTGIDLSQGQIHRARKRAQQRGYPVRFDVADAQDLPFPDERFEVVFSFGSAKHWPDPLQGIGECWRVLKPGGELLIADATSDATLEQVENFYRISQFPRLFQKPAVAILNSRMFKAARPVKAYQQIADKLQMPPGSVSQFPDMPAFLIRAKKP